MSSSRTRLLAQAAVVFCSFAWTYTVGHRGIFAFDQSIAFDGGWRIAAGQVPYKDFLMAFCPLAFAIQAAFFKLLGVTWTAQVTSAACVAAGASMAAMRIVRLLFGERRRWLILAGGLLVGMSIQSIFGTLATEPVSFFFLLLAFLAVCETLACAPRLRPLFHALAGLLTVATFLAKQNTGALAFAAVPALILGATLPRWRQALAAIGAFALGAAIAGGVFYAWLAIYSDPQAFLHYAIRVPSEVGSRRLNWKRVAFPPALFSVIPNTTPWCYAIAFGVAFRALVFSVADRDWRREVFKVPARGAALLLAVVCPFVQSIFQATTLNQYENTLALSGLTLVAGLGLDAILPRADEAKRQPPWLATLGTIIGIFLLFEIMHYGWIRDIHEAFPVGARVSRTLTAPGLNQVRWMRPTLTWFDQTYDPVPQPRQEIQPEDIESLVAYLRSLRQDFFILGDDTYLYGITGVVPPAPLLYYQERHYYLPPDFDLIDRWMTASLQQRDIRVLIVQKHKLAKWDYFPFPRTRAWMQEGFRPGPIFGPYETFLR